MICYLFGNIQGIEILFRFLQKDPEEGASLAKAVAHVVSKLGLAWWHKPHASGATNPPTPNHLCRGGLYWVD
jgi:hypothetical protein